MEIAIDSWLGLALGGAVFAAGVVAGSLIGRFGRGPQGRIRRLQQELRAAREEHETYRRSVTEHFGRASEIFRDLTGTYASLYAHLAEGARALCSERIPSLRFQEALRLADRAEEPRADGSDDAEAFRATAEDRAAGELAADVPDSGRSAAR
jgi:uncharacterized membrane-anchored protein YhcB (DUF1043 family)